MVKRTWMYTDCIRISGPQLIGVLSAQQAEGRKRPFCTYAFVGSVCTSDAFGPGYSVVRRCSISCKQGQLWCISGLHAGYVGTDTDETQRSNKSKAGRSFSKNLVRYRFFTWVYDENRMGALRFKLDPAGPF